MMVTGLARQIRLFLHDPAEVREAFIAMLAQPDPADLPPRRHIWTQPGAPDRMEKAMPGILMRWLQRRLLADVDGIVGPAVKRMKRTRARKVRRLTIAKVA